MSKTGTATTLREPTTLGRTGLRVARLGIGASYGAGAASIERAFHDYGVNYFYWGSMRRGGMRKAIRTLAPAHRDDIVVALQSYDRTGPLMKLFVERGLRRLGLDRVDVLILGWFDSPPAARIVDAARSLKVEGKVRFLAISGHHRPMFGALAEAGDDQPFDVFMFRYNAAHRGAERDVFPFLDRDRRPGTTCYTATRWGQLLDPRKMPEGERPLSGSECYRFVLSNPLADLCIAGPANEEQMTEALRALGDGPLTDEEMARARRIGDYVHGQ
jgi:aryl-alcohol dehydrogenase-like predicted oxidoreductase